MAAFRLIVFDLDGTLVDSRRDLAEAANEVLIECGAEPLTEGTVGRMVGDGAATLVSRVFQAAGCAQPADALSRFLDRYNSRLLRFTLAYPGIPEVLAELKPRATLAVLTNKPLGPTRAILDGLELSPFFGSLVVGGDGPFPRKPDPAGLRSLIDGAGASPDHALMVGDSVIDLRTARAAGVSCCLVRYGFGFEGFPLQELRDQDWCVDSPRDLAERA